MIHKADAQQYTSRKGLKSMNYVTEINAFYDWLKQNSLSGNSQALWHRLMSHCNELFWPKEFTVSNISLCEDLGISRQEFDRIRNILCQKGLITYRKKGGNKAGVYSMTSLVSHNVTQDVTQGVTQDVTQHLTRDNTHGITPSITHLPYYNKQKQKQKQNTSPEAEAAEAKTDKVPYVKIMELYNSTCTRLRKIKAVDGERKKAVSARFKKYGMDGFTSIFQKANESDFLCGNGQKNWTADFDWLINATNMAKVLEDKYINQPRKGGPNGRNPENAGNAFGNASAMDAGRNDGSGQGNISGRSIYDIGIV
jgi:hypothetical protein